MTDTVYKGNVCKLSIQEQKSGNEVWVTYTSENKLGEEPAPAQALAVSSQLWTHCVTSVASLGVFISQNPQAPQIKTFLFRNAG